VGATAELPPLINQLTSEALCLSAAIRLERRANRDHDEAKQRDHRTLAVINKVHR
jgi:hypothetical protein